MTLKQHLFNQRFKSQKNGCVTVYVTAHAATGKNPNANGKTPIRLGIDPVLSYAWSCTRMGGWAVAQSPILGTTSTINRLKSKRYIRLVAHYNRYLSLSNRCIRDPYVRWCERRTGSHWAVSCLCDCALVLYLFGSLAFSFFSFIICSRKRWFRHFIFHNFKSFIP